MMIEGGFYSLAKVWLGFGLHERADFSRGWLVL